MRFPKVDIIVLNWRGWRHTVECLRSLRESTYPNFRVIVVDNGSGEEDLQQLQTWKDSVELIEIETNRGFSGGNNVGIRYSLKNPTTDYVLILNNDVVVKPNFLTEMIRAAQLKDASMVSPVVLTYSDKEIIDRLGIVITKALLAYDMKLWEGKEPFCPSGCCALYSRRLLEDVEMAGEYFDEDFFAYCEDVDLGIRAVLRGHRAAVAEDAHVYHKGSASTFLQSPFAVFQGHRNTLWYIAKSAPSATLIRHGFWILLTQGLQLLNSLRRERRSLVLKAKLASIIGMRRMLRKRLLLQRTATSSWRVMEGMLDPRPFYLYPPKRYLKWLFRPSAEPHSYRRTIR